MEGVARNTRGHGKTLHSADWLGSAWQSESTFHQLSPYIGKTKSSMAASLVSRFTSRGHVVYDPFSGCGTFAFEAWAAGRNVIANDLSPYANVLTKAKLFPYRKLQHALSDLTRIESLAIKQTEKVDLRSVPSWVREFFHPETLREIVGWNSVLIKEQRWFLLSCLLGILHHQRPGFLSFPSSHTVPYLRLKKFPRSRFPALYAYRPVKERLQAKVVRAFRRVPDLDFHLRRTCLGQSADQLTPSVPVDAIMTSPPYMRQLDYGRDNRLRLWFLGCDDWDELDRTISPREAQFLALMERCFLRWKSALKPGAYCILVIGNECSRERHQNLPDHLVRVATETAGYSLAFQHTELIPNDRRVRRGITGSTSETILVLENNPPRRSR
jgi:hypothetical protein